LINTEWFPDISEEEVVVAVLDSATGVIRNLDGTRRSSETKENDICKVFASKPEAQRWAEHFVNMNSECMCIIFETPDKYEYVSPKEGIPTKSWWQFWK
jgi:hypothetical protein